MFEFELDITRTSEHSKMVLPDQNLLYDSRASPSQNVHCRSYPTPPCSSHSHGIAQVSTCLARLHCCSQSHSAPAFFHDTVHQYHPSFLTQTRSTCLPARLAVNLSLIRRPCVASVPICAPVSGGPSSRMVLICRSPSYTAQKG